jgi:hypothetical protein
LERAKLEFQRALYSQPSRLKRRDLKTKLWTVDIGNGLFSSLAYKFNDIIAEFVGRWRTKSEYEAIAAMEPCRRAYSIITSENGDVLDCYDAFIEGRCIASYANSPISCWDIESNKKAVENCRITVHGRKIYLRCGVKTVGAHSPKTFTIPPNTELLWNYNNSFVSYER